MRPGERIDALRKIVPYLERDPEHAVLGPVRHARRPQLRRPERRTVRPVARPRVVPPGVPQSVDKRQSPLYCVTSTRRSPEEPRSSFGAEVGHVEHRIRVTGSQALLPVLLLVDLHRPAAAGGAHEEAGRPGAQQPRPDQVLVESLRLLVADVRRLRLQADALARSARQSGKSFEHTDKTSIQTRVLVKIPSMERPETKARYPPWILAMAFSIKGTHSCFRFDCE